MPGLEHSADATGNPEALRELSDLYGPRLKRLAQGLLGDPGEAEDAAQETLLAAWRGLDAYRDEGRPGAWIATICLNLCRNRLRARARERKALAGLARGKAPSPVSSGAEAAELRAAVMAALEELPEREREAFLLIAIGGMTSAEAGEALGCPAASARVALGRARRELAARLKGFLPDR